jgi:hypothetical protein
VNVLHVTNGESTAQSLRDSGLGGEVLAWNDVLYEGPLSARTADEFRAARADFLAGCGWQVTPEQFERRDEALQRALDDRRPTVLWFEHDLYDQLQLVQILDRIADPEGVETIVIGSFPGRHDFHGLGELDPAELESLWPTRRPLTRDELELGRRAWAAVVGGPVAIEELLAGNTEALPFLRAALLRFLEERPGADGLSRSERQLLQELERGPATKIELFQAVQEREEAPFDGDTWVWRRLDRLADGRTPLVIRKREHFDLTEKGRAVLRGGARFGA